MPDLEAEEALLEDAMSGVRLVECDVCQGGGKVGLKTARAACPKCGGRGVTTTRGGLA